MLGNPFFAIVAGSSDDEGITESDTFMLQLLNHFSSFLPEQEINPSNSESDFFSEGPPRF